MLCGPQLGDHVLISIPQRIKWGQGCSLVPHFTHHRWANDIRGRLGWAFSGHQLAFWKFSSPSEAGCRERWPPRPKNVPLTDCPFFNCCPGNHKTSCPGRMETVEGRSVRLGIAGAPAIPRAPPRALRAPSRPLSHPPATTPEIDGRWQAKVGTAVGGGAKVAPFLAALLPPNHQFLEEGGCVSIFFSLWL